MSHSEVLSAISDLLNANRFPPILTEQQVADMTGFSLTWIRDRRALGEGPPILMIPPRSIRYDRDAVLAWFRQHEVQRA